MSNCLTSITALRIRCRSFHKTHPILRLENQSRWKSHLLLCCPMWSVHHPQVQRNHSWRTWSAPHLSADFALSLRCKSTVKRTHFGGIPRRVEESGLFGGKMPQTEFVKCLGFTPSLIIWPDFSCCNYPIVCIQGAAVTTIAGATPCHNLSISSNRGKSTFARGNMLHVPWDAWNGELSFAESFMLLSTVHFLHRMYNVYTYIHDNIII